MLIDAKNISVSFKKENQRIFGKKRQQVLKNVNVELFENECLGIIGESGSGKSTLGKVLTGLLKPDSGIVSIGGIPLYTKLGREEKERLRNQSSIVFQDYSSSVNSRFKVKNIIMESLRIKEKDNNNNQRIIELLEQVGLDETYINRYPHELSGGQLQRVCIARAVALKPKYILLDEAISSLDVSTQTQVMDLLIKLKDEYKLSYIFITHDLTAVTYLCNKVLFVHNGEIVEKVNDILEIRNIKNEYAKKLLNSVIGIDINPDWDVNAI